MIKCTRYSESLQVKFVRGGLYKVIKHFAVIFLFKQWYKIKKNAIISPWKEQLLWPSARMRQMSWQRFPLYQVLLMPGHLCKILNGHDWCPDLTHRTSASSWQATHRELIGLCSALGLISRSAKDIASIYQLQNQFFWQVLQYWLINFHQVLFSFFIFSFSSALRELLCSVTIGIVQNFQRILKS